MANLYNLDNKFLVTTGGNVLIGQTSAVGSSILQVTGTMTADTVDGTVITDGFITMGFAQLNRYGAAIELQYTPTNAATLVKIGANGSNPTIFNAFTGDATFAGNVTVGNSGNINIPTASSGNANLHFDGTDFKITSNSSSANLKLETSSTTRLTINSAGIIGIGPSTTSSEIYFNYNNTNNKGGLKIDYSTGQLRLTAGESGNGYHQAFYTNGSERMRITSDGKIGINVASEPLNNYGRELLVKGEISAFAQDSGDNQLLISASSTQTNISATFGSSGSYVPMQFETGGSIKMTIGTSGKIAIGNNIPMWSGQYGGALFLKGNNSTSDRHVQLTTVDSTGASIGTGLVVKGISVGIGTEEISNLLSIKGSGQNWSSSPAIKLWDTTYGKGWYVGTANNDVAGDYYIRSVTTQTAYPVAADQQFTIKQNGNIGIGTIAPGQKLAIEGSGTANESILRVNNQGQVSSRIWLRNAGQSAYIFNSGPTPDTLATGILGQAFGMGINNNSSIQFYNGATASVKMTILPSGNVAIGRTQADEKLEVEGNIKAKDVTGLLYSNVTSFSGTALVDCFEYNSAGLWEYTIRLSPNTAGSGSYTDYYYGKVGVGIGWNGSNVTQYLWVQQDQTPPRSLYPSGGGNYGITFNMLYNGGVYTSLPLGTTWYLRLQGLSTSSSGEIIFRRLG